MNEKEYELLRERFINHIYDKKKDDEMEKVINRWWNAHDATYFGLDYETYKNENLLKAILPVLFSGLSDEDIIKELDKILPPGGTYL